MFVLGCSKFIRMCHTKGFVRQRGTSEWKVRLLDRIIEEYPMLKSKWDKLPNNELKVMFQSDFENATESILKQLNQDNSILLEGWIKFRLKHPAKIICTK